MQDGDVIDRIVVGAGLRGLVAAWRARRRGESVRVLEAAAFPTDPFRAIARDGWRLEQGPAFLLPRRDGMHEGLYDLPSGVRLVEAPATARLPALAVRRGLVAYRGGGRVAAMVGRKVATALRARRRGAGAETLEALLVRRLGRRTTDELAAPFVRLLHGASPAVLGAAECAPKLVVADRRRHGLGAHGSPAPTVIDGGMAALGRAIARDLGSALRPDAAVVDLTLAHGDPVTLRTADGGAHRACRVTLAIDERAQADLIGPHFPHHADILRAVPTAPLVGVTVGLGPSVAERLPSEGWGVLRGRGGPVRFLGVVFASRLAPATAPPDHALLQVLLGGGEDRDVLAMDDDWLTRIVRADLERILGRGLDATVLDVWRRPHGYVLPAPGHRARLARIAADLDGLGVHLPESRGVGGPFGDPTLHL